MKKYTLLKSAAVAGLTYSISVAATKMFSHQAPRKIKPFFSQRAPYIFAHRGGLGLAPEHTMAAFQQAAELQVDGFEIDIRLTKDNAIVVFHDALVDRVSNGSGLVSEHTLEELRALDFGYHFKDLNGNYPFRGRQDAKIVTLSELFEAFPDMLINIDIKDLSNTVKGKLAPALLYQLIVEKNSCDRVCVTSFDDEQIMRFNQFAHDKITIGAGQKEVARAFAAFHSGFKHTYQPQADTFQIPVQFNGIPLNSESFIAYLQKLNIAVGYWVVNSIDEMDDLLKRGAHTIVTDRPDIAMRLVHERLSNKV
ncbi:glycerophosphodiester phosphodiesterase [Macrococcus capreoli]|uniref:glycerophosphodiester phosphodiesterase n=1 Tax=Macrococcus capreoli TaxID=2982690 RepID=UPI0021D60FC2|nr:glycerophosphodiester phosphodiesterase [Macrococcus sp. TMW 2.2395]MCU7558056.1 glycerophosphodiester phosphodiesterase [Macrococcus sp. TMW 2.2395]